MGGDGRAPCLLLGQWGLHKEALPTTSAAPRAGVLLKDREQWVSMGGGGRGRVANEDGGGWVFLKTHRKATV